MFAGLLLTAVSAATMRAALFQRKSRSGWLEELDGIRTDALEQPDGELGEVVATEDDIWTDLRDGGEYSDPHEITSLYATDATPDDPNGKAAKEAKPAPKSTPKPAKAAAKGLGKVSGKAPRSARAKGEPAEQLPPPPPAPDADLAEFLAPPPAAPPAPQLSELPPPPAPPTTELPPPPAPPAAERPPIDPDEIWTSNHDAPSAPPVTQYESEQIWVQPAPHPIRPSEMWHPAELAPPLLGEETYEQVEERVSSADLDDRSPIDPGPAPDFGMEPAASMDELDRDLAETLESELVAAADVAVVPEDPAPTPAAPAPSTKGLVGGPVARRVRRDRPAERTRAPLPSPEELAPGTAPLGESTVEKRPRNDRGERSPLPVQPLPPAALPSRSNRLPGLESLPATPSSVVTPRSIGPVPEEPVAVAPEPVAAGEVVSEPTLDTADLAAHVAPEPAASAASAPVLDGYDGEDDDSISIDAGDTPLTIGADGMVPVAGTIVRVGGARQAMASLETDGAAVALAEGWCWVAPGEGSADPVHIDMVAGRLTVATGATALAVVEADGSSFVIVADGSADLRRGADGAQLARGSIVMVDTSGAAQVDQASDTEIVADPIVAQNLALDAEL